MNKYSNILMGFGLGVALVCTTGCRDDFADINSSPSQVTVGDPSYLFAMAVMDFDPLHLLVLRCTDADIMDADGGTDRQLHGKFCTDNRYRWR